MPDLSRRTLFLAAGVATMWPGFAGATSGRAAAPTSVRRLARQVTSLTDRFYRAALQQTRFEDASVRRYAHELAADHSARASLLGSSEEDGGAAEAPWSPSLDGVVRASGWRGEFDPFGGDPHFLLAAHVLESACADALRLGAGREPDLTAVAAEAAYHAGLVRTALSATAAGRTAKPFAEAATRLFARLREDDGVAGDPMRTAMKTLFPPSSSRMLSARAQGRLHELERLVA